MQNSQKTEKDDNTDNQSLPENVSLAVSIAQSSGSVVPQDTIDLMCKVNGEEISADIAVEQIIQTHNLSVGNM